MYEKKGPSYASDLRKICKKLGYVNFVEGIIKLYEEGKSQREIGEIFERTQKWVSHVMKCFDIPARPRGGANFKGKKNDTIRKSI